MKLSRREFIRYTAYAGGYLALPATTACTFTQKYNEKTGSVLSNIRIIDAHSHPGGFHKHTVGRNVNDYSSTISQMQELGMEAGVFSALGDYSATSKGKRGSSEYDLVMKQFRYLEQLASSNKLKFVLKSTDIPEAIGPETPPGAILAVEGGDVLVEDLSNVNRLYDYGVRTITLIHRSHNGIGDTMTKRPRFYSLPAKGKKVVERMQELGMIVDVAHAGFFTLKGIVEMSAAPIIDSHTNLFDGTGRFTRFRNNFECELIVKTGGLVCTWPMASSGRRNIKAWAAEILQMKKRFGMEHVALGTDGGGGLPDLVFGYRDIRNLVDLAEAMLEVGLTRQDIAMFMGGNFKRIFQTCVG